MSWWCRYFVKMVSRDNTGRFNIWYSIGVFVSTEGRLYSISQKKQKLFLSYLVSQNSLSNPNTFHSEAPRIRVTTLKYFLEKINTIYHAGPLYSRKINLPRGKTN